MRRCSQCLPIRRKSSQPSPLGATSSTRSRCVKPSLICCSIGRRPRGSWPGWQRCLTANLGAPPGARTLNQRIKSRFPTVSPSAVPCHLTCVSALRQCDPYQPVPGRDGTFRGKIRGSSSRPAVVRTRKRRVGEHERDRSLPSSLTCPRPPWSAPRGHTIICNADHRRRRRRATSRRYMTRGRQDYRRLIRIDAGVRKSRRVEPSDRRQTPALS
jgi:hypothetical protein